MKLIDSQLAYHNQSKELLLGLRSNWGENTDTATESNNILDRVMARDDNEYYPQETASSYAASSKSRNMSRESSQDSLPNSHQSSTTRQSSTTHLGMIRYTNLTLPLN